MDPRNYLAVNVLGTTVATKIFSNFLRFSVDTISDECYHYPSIKNEVASFKGGLMAGSA